MWSYRGIQQIIKSYCLICIFKLRKNLFELLSKDGNIILSLKARKSEMRLFDKTLYVGGFKSQGYSKS